MGNNNGFANLGAYDMNRFFIFWITFFCITTPTFSLAEEWPAWVEVTELPADDESSDEFVDGGVHQMLFDVQVRLNSDGYDRFSRRVVKVVTRAGLEDVGAARFDFDPIDEELVIHDIWRERDGVRSKVENLEFIDIRRENAIDYGILDGRLTRYTDLNDLRVGDTIDISWTVRVKPTVFPEHFQYWRTKTPYFGFQIDQFVLLAPQTRDIAITGPAKPKISTVDEWARYIWRHENTPVFDPEDSIKTWEAIYGETQITTASSWAMVTERIVDAYASQPLPAELIDIVDQFDGTEAERVTAAFRLVQEQIRYMGIEIGAGGYLPRDPSTVWARRYGDCKDKALLLVSILDRMDIAADVVLVNLYDGDLLVDYLPSPYIFDHAIVRVHGEDGPYFLDPTDVLQGGVGNTIRTTDFYWALPVTEQSDTLVAVPQQQMTEPSYEVLSRYEFTDNGNFAAELFVETTYRGDDADWQRYHFSRSGTEDRVENLFEWYAERYPGAQALTPFHFEDDVNANSVVIYEHYGLTDEGLSEHRRAFWMNPYAIAGELEDLPDKDIDAPFPLDPLFQRHRVELVGIPGLDVPPEIMMMNPFFRYTRTGFEIEGGIAADFEIQTLVTEIYPDDAEAYAEAVEAQDDKRDRRFNLGVSNRILGEPIFMGLTVQSAITCGSLLFIFFIVFLSGRRGYVAEREAWRQKTNGSS